MVADMRSSKEIGRQLDLSPYAVDKRIERAIATLSVSSRTEAARLLSQSEAGYEPFVCETSDLPPSSNISDSRASADEWSPAAGNGRRYLQDHQQFEYDYPIPAQQRSTLLSALLGIGPSLELNLRMKMVIVFSCIVLFTVTTILMGVVIEYVSRFF